MTEVEMVERHHQLDGHEFEHAQGDGEGQGSLARCSPWGQKELDTPERLNTCARCQGAYGCIKGARRNSPPSRASYITLWMLSCSLCSAAPDTCSQAVSAQMKKAYGQDFLPERDLLVEQRHVCVAGVREGSY